jgi:hypothetical protein
MNFACVVLPVYFVADVERCKACSSLQLEFMFLIFSLLAFVCVCVDLILLFVLPMRSFACICCRAFGCSCFINSHGVEARALLRADLGHILLACSCCSFVFFDSGHADDDIACFSDVLMNKQESFLRRGVSRPPPLFLPAFSFPSLRDFFAALG